MVKGSISECLPDFQFHVIANDVFNDGGVHDGIDGFLRNHGTEEKVEDTEVSWHKKRRSDAPLPETCCPTTRSLIGDFHLIELPLRELCTESRTNLARAQGCDVKGTGTGCESLLNPRPSIPSFGP